MIRLLMSWLKKILSIKEDLGNNVGEIDNYLREEMQREMGKRP